MKTFLHFFRRYKLLIPILLVTFLAYSNTLSADFVWDDHYFIFGWPQMQNFQLDQLITGSQPEGQQGVYRPVRSLMYAITYQLYGSNPFWYHLQAIFIHLTVISLVYAIIQKLTSDNLISFLSTTIFALHPTHAEDISWITTSYDIIGIIFALISFYLIISKSPKNSTNWALIFSVLAIFSYELCSILPLLICAYFLLIKQFSIKKTLNFTKKYCIILGVYWFFRFSILQGIGRLNPITQNVSEKILLIFQIFYRYILLLIAPFKLNINHTLFDNIPSLFYLDYNSNQALSIPLLSVANLLSVSVITITIIVFLLALRKERLIAFGLIWIILGLIPVIQIIPQPIIFAEKYLYFASIGFSLLAGIFFVQISKHINPRHQQPFLLAVSLLIVGTYMAVTYNRNFIWKNNLSLMSAAIVQNPQSAAINSSLGSAYLGQGNTDQAIYYYQKAIELNPSITSYYRHLAETYETQGELEQAKQIYLTLLERYPQSITLLKRLAHIASQQQNQLVAAQYYEKILQLNPSDTEAKQHLLILNAY